MNIKDEHIGTKILRHKIRKGSEHGNLELNGHKRDNAPALAISNRASMGVNAPFKFNHFLKVF